MPTDPAPQPEVARCLLLLEEEPHDRLLIARAARRAGLTHPLAIVHDAAQAIAYLAGRPPYDDPAQRRPPALALLDVTLPRTSALEVLRWMRAQPGLQRLPAVVLSSSALPDDVRRAYEAGASSYLVKPIAFQALCNVMARIDRYWLGLNAPPDLGTP